MTSRLTPQSRLLRTAAMPYQSNFAFNATLRRVADYGRRAALTRLTLLGAAALTLALVSASWPAWVVVTGAALGSYLSWATNTAQITGRLPVEPLARWSTAITQGGLGRFQPDVSGILEGLSYVPLACLGPWLMQGEAAHVRLLLLGLAMLWVASCVCAVFLDPAFYSVHAVPRYASLGRAVVGPVAGVLAILVAAPAPWTASDRTAATIIAGSLALLQLRIRETDRLLTSADAFVDTERVTARDDLLVHAHRLLSTPINRLGLFLEPAREEDDGGQRWDLFRDVRVGYSTLLAVDIASDVDIDWPGLLMSDLRRIQGSTGMSVTLDIPEDRLSAADRRLAHYLLDDLASNAANSGAETCELRMYRDGPLWRVSARDDGRPIVPAAWMREGGDLTRLLQQLRRTGVGDIVAVSMNHPKLIEAHWIANVEVGGT